MSARIYIEGGGQSKELKTRCREAFQKLLENAGISENKPRLVACGGRNAAFDHFQTAHAEQRPSEYVAMIIDSEDPPANIERTWEHLRTRDGWTAPAGAADEQVLFMTTCMETWIASDRSALKEHFGQCLQMNAVPPAHNIEQRNRAQIFQELTHATRECKSPYEKGDTSFKLLGTLSPATLANLPSFDRMARILKQKL